jgi:transposase-like protein
MMERLNKELKRRSKVVGAFPNDDSHLRLVVSILININKDMDNFKEILNYAIEPILGFRSFLQQVLDTTKEGISL